MLSQLNFRCLNKSLIDSKKNFAFGYSSKTFGYSSKTFVESTKLLLIQPKFGYKKTFWFFSSQDPTKFWPI